MNCYTAAAWFNRRPHWLKEVVYLLTGYQVRRVELTHRVDAGLFAYTVTRWRWSWQRVSKERITP